MRTRTNAEWQTLYHTRWKAPFAHLPKHVRAKLVRGCIGKAVYDSVEEALPVIAEMPARPGMYLKAYSCPLCGCIHIGNSSTPNTMPQRAIDPNKSIDAAS